MSTRTFELSKITEARRAEIFAAAPELVGIVSIPLLENVEDAEIYARGKISESLASYNCAVDVESIEFRNGEYFHVIMRVHD